MREIAASEAKAKFAELLNYVERGETVVITRHGRAIARLAPEESRRRAEAEAALDRIRMRAKRNGRVTAEEIISMRDEGRRR